jgi:hypothetical protein
MLFQKLFRLLVLGGAMLGGASTGCDGQAQTTDKKTDTSDAGQSSASSASGGTQTADAGTDAGTSSGGGVIGW